MILAITRSMRLYAKNWRIWWSLRPKYRHALVGDSFGWIEFCLAPVAAASAVMDAEHQAAHAELVQPLVVTDHKAGDSEEHY